MSIGRKLSHFGTQEQAVTQKEDLPGEPQGPGTDQKDVIQDALPVQGAGREEEKGLQVPGFKAVLPTKRPYNSLATLSTMMDEDTCRINQGLHPHPLGVTGFAGMIRGAEQGRGLGILGEMRPSLKQPRNFQQVMSPTCENDLSAFGMSSASSSQVTLRETAPKRCKQEGPPIDEGEKKVNLLDLKKGK